MVNRSAKEGGGGGVQSVFNGSNDVCLSILDPVGPMIERKGQEKYAFETSSLISSKFLNTITQ